MSATPHTSSDPWTLKGRTWVFILPKRSELASGFAAPFEADALGSSGEYIGGPGFIMIVSSTESPFGPYNELIYSPGNWKYPDGTEGLRITRVYVSSKEIIEFGRKTWSIPKHFANFDITDQKNGSTTIAITHPDASSPFFKATMKPVPLLSSIPLPFSSKSLGKHPTIQPALPAGEEPEEVGTTEWVSMRSVMQGKFRLASITPGLEGKQYGDGVGIPAISPWGVGAWTEELNHLEFEMDNIPNPVPT